MTAIPPTGLDKLTRIASTLSRLVSHANEAVPRGHGAPFDEASVAELRACRELTIEGGNPLGDEGELLLLALDHRFRAPDNVRRHKWELIAYALLMLVRDTLNDVLERRRLIIRHD